MLNLPKLIYYIWLFCRLSSPLLRNNWSFCLLSITVFLLSLKVWLTFPWLSNILFLRLSYSLIFSLSLLASYERSRSFYFIIISSLNYGVSLLFTTLLGSGIICSLCSDGAWLSWLRTIRWLEIFFITDIFFDWLVYILLRYYSPLTDLLSSLFSLSMLFLEPKLLNDYSYWLLLS